MLSIEEILDRQHVLMKSMGWPAGEPIIEGNEDAAKSHLLAAIHECTEAMNEMNWKPWKANKKPVDPQKLATELMDIIQFVANAALVMNLSSWDLERALREKWEVNFQRIEQGEVTNGSTTTSS